MISLIQSSFDTARDAVTQVARRPSFLRKLDIAVLALIVASVLVVMADSVQELHQQYGHALYAAEWAFTLLFSAEYLLRLCTAKKPAAYARSFFGIVDLVSVLPTYLAFFFPGLHALIDVRLLRLLRVFRILGLSIYLEEGQMLMRALTRARRKIFVFIGGMFVLTVILGTVIFLVEGPENGITSIPVGVYWAAVTMSTTGYGDLTPHTPLGRLITSCAILLGYGIIAFPTGIMGAELVASALERTRANARPAVGDEPCCPHCGVALPMQGAPAPRAHAVAPPKGRDAR
ncbi:ion transporter [Burkholderia cenocepacia]|uniref:ion transporter n=1 Tax=Burkholderia cenocepacia TaxID=95486 RepID=UPI00196B77C5|nr:ion transporter [Burkholderia cenocepacia]MBN3503088.1 ion transporter [Burkholderia cenocepacia]MCO1394406.1 ion transporter [Burkholderia cenocepacia]MCO1404778.1 ion transporter [Burkholderia cenocepacia]UQN96310.1 ion transporter [Burkholderia cenocepacia]UQO02723.1 ion transporter [Burkholderia cenocepacia]